MRERTLHGIIKSNLVPDLEKASDEYSVWDAISDQHKYYIEFKCRHTHYSTLFLEKKKYDALQKEAAKLGYRPVYINSTPRGIYIWRLDQITPVWEERLMPRTTTFGNTEKIMKPGLMLDTRDAARAFHLPKQGDTTLQEMPRYKK